MNGVVNTELQADYMDSIRYYTDQLMKYKRIKRYIEYGYFVPFRGFFFNKVRQLISATERNIELFVKLYCGDDVFGTKSKKLGIKSQCFFL